MPEELITRIREIATQLAEQQSMPDDWWQEPLDEALRGLQEQLEAAQRVVDAARTVSEIEATGTLPDFQPLADALAALNPAKRPS